MKQYILEGAEVSYLLGMMGAKSVWGMDNGNLFPPDDTDKEALFADGFAALQEHKWLLPIEGNQKKLNVGLTMLAVTVADPEYVVITTHYNQTGSAQSVTHFLTDDLIVEQTMDAGKYHFLTFDDTNLLIKRIQAGLELSGSVQSSVDTISLDAPLFEEIATLAASQKTEALSTLLQKNGITEPKIIDLFQTLHLAYREADIVIGRTHGRLTAKRDVVLFQHNSSKWLMWNDKENNALLFKLACLDSFSSLFKGFLDDLYAVAPIS